MTITLNGTTGITNDGGYTGDGVVFADTTPSNTLVTTTGGNVGIGTLSPTRKLEVGSLGAFRLQTGSVTMDCTPTAGATDSFVWNTSVNAIYAWSMAGTERMRIDSSGNLQFNSGYGSVATAYGCRAWVNFNGTGTVAIRASGNVTSITDNATGNYTVNFTTAMPDANYVVVASGASTASDFRAAFPNYSTAPAAGSCQICTSNSYVVNSPLYDTEYVRVAIFR